MRLIDADDLPKHKQLEPMGNGQYEEIEIIYAKDIDNIPVYDMVHIEVYRDLYEKYIELKHEAENKDVKFGKWESDNKYTYCSNCGYHYSDKHFFEVYEFAYCPHCGAKMDICEDTYCGWQKELAIAMFKFNKAMEEGFCEIAKKIKRRL